MKENYRVIDPGVPRGQGTGYQNQPQSANFDIREKKRLEREARIQREKEELQQLQQFNPFGKGGAGAPLRDQDGFLVNNRRPFSQVREPSSQFQNQMVPSYSNQNLMQNQGYQLPQSQIQKPSYQALNQSLDVGQAASNYYQNAQQLVRQGGGNQASQQQQKAKITTDETAEQREERYRKQLQYQDVLRQQMEEKKAKEEELKRKRQEEDMKYEARIKEEIERERQMQINEKIKQEQKQNMFRENQSEIQSNFNRHKGSTKIAHSPISQHSKAQDKLNYSVDHDRDRQNEGNFRFESKRQQDSVSNYGGPQYQVQQPQQLPPFQYPPQMANPQNSLFLNQIENNFSSELTKLKQDMMLQQQQFENQLKELRDEAMKNIDYRAKAEQELVRMRVNSQRESQRPHHSSKAITERDNSNIVRRSMAGMNNYEKLFFGGINNPVGGVVGAPSIQNQNQLYQKFQLDQQFPVNQSQVESQGLGGKFEASISLRAESSFVPLIQQIQQTQQPSTIAQQQPKFQDTAQLIDNLQSNHIKLETKKTIPLQQSKKPITPVQQDKFDGDISLNQLESAINEIAELNMGENYKETQKALAQARVQSSHQDMRPLHKKQTQKTGNIPEYKGIQDQDQELNQLVTQLSHNNHNLNEKEEIKKEYLMRDVPPLGSIMESSNEQTFPSQAFGSLNDPKNMQIYQ